MNTKVITVLAYALFLGACNDGTLLYVSPGGNDSHAGTPGEPLRTFEGAQSAVRTALKESPGRKVTVLFKGGEYPVEQAIKLTAEDSGSPGAPVVYRAAEGETPVFTGSKILASWARAGDAEALKRLDASVRDKIYVTDLRAAGVTDFGDPTEAGKRPELICNGQLQSLARWPNEGFVRAGRMKGATPLPETYISKYGRKEGVFEYTDAVQDRWDAEEDVRLGGYWYWDWSDEFQTVERWDAATRTAYLREPYHRYGYRDSLRYFGLNLFCEIDRPGEWYLNRTAGKLYWYPPEGVDPAKAEVRLTCFAGPYMLAADGCSYLTIEGLTFREGRGTALLIRGGARNLLSGCRIERFGRDGVHIEEGAEHGVTGCYLSAFGHGGFKITGGNRQTLTPAGHFVEHTVVENFSLFQRTYEPAVHLTGCGIRIANNRFSHSSSSAMRLEGNDFLIEYNEVSRVVNESDDQGGIDMWYNPSYRGIEIRYNRWADISGGTRHGAAGVRFDDMISGMLVYGNLFERCGAHNFGGVQIHGGKDNRIRNNVFYHCPFAVSFSPWSEERWIQELDTPAIQEKLYKEVDINSEIYQRKYPELINIRQGVNVNTVTDNLLVSCNQLFNNRPAETIAGNNNTIPDSEGEPVEAFCTDKTLAAYGMQPIPVAAIGPKNNRWMEAIQKERD
ncbi:MAG: right-handed parallel beta-helix repeat-containing protein [Tannerellaceae bacterium]|jgi:hypothetical protein|nr:right-handed parallel beta-helix repeat-containing protein [Tannerellaceae bacterium]